MTQLKKLLEMLFEYGILVSLNGDNLKIQAPEGPMKQEFVTQI